MITNCVTQFNAFLWPKFMFSGNLINYLETAKATDHLIRHQHPFTMWYLQDKVSGTVACLCFWKAVCGVSHLHHEIRVWRAALADKMKQAIAGSGNYSICSTQRILWTLSSCVKAPFNKQRTTNKAEECPPPHESFRSTPLAYFHHTPQFLGECRKRWHRRGKSIGH